MWDACFKDIGFGVEVIEGGETLMAANIVTYDFFRLLGMVVVFMILFEGDDIESGLFSGLLV